MILPAPLSTGDAVALVAPAFRPDDAAVEQAVALLAGWGLRAVLQYGLTGRHLYHCAPPQDRAQALADAWTAPGVRGIWCLRGGYGSAEVLERLDTSLPTQYPCRVMGFSDFTALLGWTMLHGDHAVLYGPNAAHDSLHRDHPHFEVVVEAVRRAWCEPLPATCFPCQATSDDTVVEGRLVGGCLSLLASTIGTSWAFNAQDGVVFLEDVNEPPQTIHRLLVQMHQAGALAGARALALGDFSTFSRGDINAHTVLAELAARWGLPLLHGLQAGHLLHQLPLPLGLRVSYNAVAGGLTPVRS